MLKLKIVPFLCGILLLVNLFANSAAHAEVKFLPEYDWKVSRATPSDVRFVSYKNGNGFEKKNGSQWVELGPGHVELNTFSEMEKTAKTLRLFDHNNQHSILLHFGSLQIFSCPGGNSCSGQTNLLGPMEQYIGQDTTRLIRNIQPPTKPDLSQPWSSDFGAIFWNQAYYDDPEKMLFGNIWYDKDSHSFGFQGGWTRASDSSKRGFVYFKFSHDGKSFKGHYTNVNLPEQGERPWTGKAIR